MIAPCGHICFHWAKCSNNLHVRVKVAKAKIMFVEEIVDCKNSQLCPCTRTLIKACIPFWLPKLSLKENMNDKHLSRQEDFNSKDKLTFFNGLKKLKK